MTLPPPDKKRRTGVHTTVPCERSSQSSAQNDTERSHKTPRRQKGPTHATPPTGTEGKLPPPPSRSHEVPQKSDSQAAQHVQSTYKGDIFSAMESYRLDIGTPAWMEKAQSIGARL